MEAKEIKKGDMVMYGNYMYEVAGISSALGSPIVEIYDEPPSKHIDRLWPDDLRKPTAFEFATQSCCRELKSMGIKTSDNFPEKWKEIYPIIEKWALKINEDMEDDLIDMEDFTAEVESLF